MDVVTQNALQRLLQQVGSGVGTHNGLAALHIDGGKNHIVRFQGAAAHHAGVQVLAALVLLDTGDLKAAVAHQNHTEVRSLAAHFRIEGGLVQNDDALLTGGNGAGNLLANAHSQNLGLAVILLIAHEIGGRGVQAQVDACPT